MEKVKLMKTTERCSQCGEKLKVLNVRFCNTECKTKYENQ